MELMVIPGTAGFLLVELRNYCSETYEKIIFRISVFTQNSYKIDQNVIKKGKKKISSRRCRIFPNWVYKNMQTPPPPSPSEVAMKDAHSAESNVKSILRFFQLLFFLSYG